VCRQLDQIWSASYQEISCFYLPATNNLVWTVTQFLLYVSTTAMIAYKSGPFGFRLLLRLQGSAVARALIPATISTVFLLCAWKIFPRESFGQMEERFIGHPYAIGECPAFNY